MEEMLDLKEVLALVKLKRSTVYLAIQAGEFPPPIKLGKRRAVWLKKDLECWLARKLAERKKGSRYWGTE
jgi:prophage regulatory protein